MPSTQHLTSPIRHAMRRPLCILLCHHPVARRDSIPFHCGAVCNITLHYITLQYSTCHGMTFHYITLHYITLQYNTLHYVRSSSTDCSPRFHSSTLHFITLNDMTLHNITLHCITLGRRPPTARSRDRHRAARALGRHQGPSVRQR